MQNQFSRTELLIGKQSLNKLKNSRVAIFGIGGVGGHTADALARCGIGTLDLTDFDKFSITNINRQIYANINTLDRFKVDVAKEKILEINPECNVITRKTIFSPENSAEYDLRSYDYIIDAVDNVTAKIELVIKANEANTPIISSMGAGNKLHPELFEIADIYKTSVCPLAKVMRQELKKLGVKKLKVVYSKEFPAKSNLVDGKRIPASISFVPSAAGLIIAGEVVRDLISK